MAVVVAAAGGGGGGGGGGEEEEDTRRKRELEITYALKIVQRQAVPPMAIVSSFTMVV